MCIYVYVCTWHSALEAFRRTDQAGWTPVHLAVDARSPHVSIVEALLQLSPEPALIQDKVVLPHTFLSQLLTHLVGQFGRTPLHLALDRDVVEKEIVYTLVNKAWQAVTMKDNVRKKKPCYRVSYVPFLSATSS